MLSFFHRRTLLQYTAIIITVVLTISIYIFDIIECKYS